ncbi:MAG: peptide deformylase, partial [Nitrospinota bacterium]
MARSHRRRWPAGRGTLYNRGEARWEDSVALLKVAQLGHPVLRQKTRPVPPGRIGQPELERLITDMVETLREY